MRTLDDDDDDDICCDAGDEKLSMWWLVNGSCIEFSSGIDSINGLDEVCGCCCCCCCCVDGKLGPCDDDEVGAIEAGSK